MADRLQSNTVHKPTIRVIDPRSYSHQRNLSNSLSPAQNVEQSSRTTYSKEPQKTIQQLLPSTKPQLDEQAYKEKMEQLESRMNQENQYLRQATQSTFEKLRQANQTILSLKKQNQELEKQVKRQVDKIQLQNISSKELTGIADQMRRENAALNLRVRDMTANLAEVKSSQGSNLRDRVVELQNENKALRAQIDCKGIHSHNAGRPRQNLTITVNHIENDLENGQNSPQTTRLSFLNGIRTSRKSLDRQSAMSMDPSPNSSRRQRSLGRSNFIDSELSPKQSARMQILFQEINIIKKNFSSGAAVSAPTVNKLFSLIQHLTNALNKRNDENVGLKNKLKQFGQMMLNIVPTKIRNSQHPNDSNDFILEEPQSSSSILPLPTADYENTSRTLDKRQRNTNSFDSFSRSPESSKGQDFSRSLIRPRNSMGGLKRDSPQGRYPSVDMARQKYNYVYKKMDLKDYLLKRIDLVESMELVTKLTEVVEKHLLVHPWRLRSSDFYILYCEGECPNSLKTRVQLKQRSNLNQSAPVSQLQMMYSLGSIFQEILKNIYIETFADQKLFEKAVSPAFNTIIKNLKAQDSQRPDMEKFKSLLNRLNS